MSTSLPSNHPPIAEGADPLTCPMFAAIQKTASTPETTTGTMWVADYYKEDRPELLYKFIEERVLGTIITTGVDGTIHANAIPFTVHYDETTEKHTLQCHFPLQSAEQFKSIEDQLDKDILIIFSGPDSYISSNWLPSKFQTHKEVPTWNYSIVHVVGKPTLYKDVEWVRKQLVQLTERVEAMVGEKKPWKLTDSPTSYINQVISSSLIGIEISIDKIQGKMKSSQNKNLTDRNGMIAALERIGNNDSANMIKHKGILGYWDKSGIDDDQNNISELQLKLQRANIFQIVFVSIIVALLCAYIKK